MSDEVAELVVRGSQLSREDRERLVQALLETLNETATSDLDPAREAEIEHRHAQYDRGEVQAIDALDVFAKARRLAAG